MQSGDVSGDCRSPLNHLVHSLEESRRDGEERPEHIVIGMHDDRLESLAVVGHTVTIFNDGISRDF